MIRRALALALLLALLGAVVLSCNGTTGDQLITFSAYASGVQGASQPFTAGKFTIQLTAARMHIGAIYFNEAPPGTGFDGPTCISSGTFAAQVPGPVDVDLLSTGPQEFTVYGNGTADTALSWQLWLTDGDVDEVNFTPVAQVEGTATDMTNGNVTSFGAVVTINAVNRSKGSPDPTQPGLDPLCKTRIVQIPTNLPFFQGGALYMTVDPRVWFTQQSLPIDFSDDQLPPIDDASCNPDFNVFTNAQSYALSPETPPPASQTCGGPSQPCCAGDVCSGAWTCSSGTCGPASCIPNSSFLAGTVPGSTAGNDFYSEVTSAAPFSVRYVTPPP